MRATSPASTGEHTPGRVVFCGVYNPDIIEFAGFALPGDPSVNLRMTKLVCDDVWITENKKYFQNARFLL